ncbi:ABC transporter substrate-binding protein [Aggregatimonas sangjinii]|nr:ABC transporter substrate-binding protein [Aggregatimonas sangjinii]
MGLQEYVHGITFECPQQALSEKEIVVRCILEGKAYSSHEIDRLFSASKRDGKSLYYVEERILEAIAPDIIFTQDVCDVCQIDTECTAAAVAHLPKQPELISITPASLQDVFENALTIARALKRENAGIAYVDVLNEQLNDIDRLLNSAAVQTKEVLLLEWIDPIFNCGHWIPHQIERAGGIDRLSRPAGDSTVIDWSAVVAYNPEILVIAPCGFTIARTLKEMHLLTEKPEWSSLRAVQNNAVYIADFDLFTQSSAHTLTRGITLLAALFHPGVVAIPENLVRKFVRFSEKVIHN